MEQNYVPTFADVFSSDALHLVIRGFLLRTGVPILILLPDSGYDNNRPESWPPNVLGDPKNCCDEACFNVVHAKCRDALLSNKRVLKKVICTAHPRARHLLRVIRVPISNQSQAILVTGPVPQTILNKSHDRSEIRIPHRGHDQDSESVEREFRSLGDSIQSIVASYGYLSSLCGKRLFVSGYRSISAEIPNFIDHIFDDLDRAFESMLEFLEKMCDSKLTALCVLDRSRRENDKSEGILVVRHVRGPTTLSRSIGRDPAYPEIIRIDDSFVGRAITTNRLVYDDNLTPGHFAWRKAIKEYGLTRSLALPLVLPSGKEILGGIICFPNRPIWQEEYPAITRFSKKVAVSLFLATRNELHKRSSEFSRNLMTVSTSTGQDFYDQMADLIRKTLRAAAVSIFLVDKSRDGLKLTGTTDHSTGARTLVGNTVYRLGEGITGYVANQPSDPPYGEIVHDLYDDERRSDSFSENVPDTPSGKHSMMVTQVVSTNGDVLGVIRCVDIQPVHDSVYNCFNRFHLEGFQFWAGIFGIIYMLKVKLNLNHEFNLAFLHELDSTLTGVRNDMILARSYFSRMDRDQALRKIDDALAMSEVMAQLVDDLNFGTLLAVEGTFNLPPILDDWFPLQRTFLQPMKNAFEQLAIDDRNISIRYDPLPVEVSVDKRRFLQVLSNVLRNAIKYSYNPRFDGVSRSMLKDIQIICERDHIGRLLIKVANWGIGVPEDEDESVFDLYRKGSNASDQVAAGLGLGLFLCRSIMRQHSGDMVLTSPGNPTIFTLTLPSYRVRSIRKE